MPITDLYWLDVEEEINSLEDLENILLTIRDIKQIPEFYYTPEEIQNRQDKTIK